MRLYLLKRGCRSVVGGFASVHVLAPATFWSGRLCVPPSRLAVDGHVSNVLDVEVGMHPK